MRATPRSRRDFLAQASVGTASLGLGGLTGLAEFAPASASEQELRPDDVRMSQDIEPLVRMIESAGENAVGEMIEKLQAGATYRQFVAALFIAAARMDASPHRVYMVHAAQRLSMGLPRDQCLLPLFWGLHGVANGQRGDGLRFPNVDVSLVSSKTAERELHSAMRAYDAERSSAALVNLGRRIGARRAFSQLWQYAGRNDGFIGHYAIAMSNAWRVLEVTGWQYAEPVFQFVVHQLNSNKGMHRSHRSNWQRSGKLGESFAIDWANMKRDHGATLELLDLLRSADPNVVGEEIFKQLRDGSIQAGSVWDAAHLAAAESMFRWPETWGLNQRALHHTTSTTALHDAFDACDDPRTRLYLLLQGAGWASSFWRQLYKNRDVKITEIPEADIADSASDALEDIFASAPRRRFDSKRQRIEPRPEGSRAAIDTLAQKTFAYTSRHGDDSYVDMLLLVTTLKATDIHDLKFTVATLENCRQVDPRWRPHLLAAHAHYMHGTRSDDRPFVIAARQQLQKTGTTVKRPKL